MNMLIFLGITLAAGLVCSTPGLIFGRWLVARGIAKDHSVLLVTVTVGVIALAHLKSFPWPWWFYAMVSLFAFAVYRSDWWSYSSQGAWWWRDKNGNSSKEKTSWLSILLIALAGVAVVAMTIWGLWNVSH
jgi:hypothetical protein